MPETVYTCDREECLIKFENTELLFDMEKDGEVKRFCIQCGPHMENTDGWAFKDEDVNRLRKHGVFHIPRNPLLLSAGSVITALETGPEINPEPEPKPLWAQEILEPTESDMEIMKKQEQAAKAWKPKSRIIPTERNPDNK